MNKYLQMTRDEQEKALAKLEDEYRSYLKTIGLPSLRQLERSHAIAYSLRFDNKPQSIDAIIERLMGRTKPAPVSKRGAPTKSNYYDPTLEPHLEEIRRSVLGDDAPNPEDAWIMREWMGNSVHSKDLYNVEEENAAEEEPNKEEDDPIPRKKREAEPVYKNQTKRGLLEILPGGYGYVRTQNCQPAEEDDVFVSEAQIKMWHLREGDEIDCSIEQRGKDIAVLTGVKLVNGSSMGEFESRADFERLTPAYPNQKIALAKTDAAPLSLRLLDLFAPIGKGQRALITAPPKTGKTTLIKEIARSIAENNPEIETIVLLLDERPEVITDFKFSLGETKVVSTAFDEDPIRHIRAAKLSIASAKRMAEQGKDVVILLDSINKLARVYNSVADSTGKTFAGGVEPDAVSGVKRFLSAARRTLERGSVTVVAAAQVDTGSALDNIIYEELKDTINCEVFLSGELASRWIFPAIDLTKSCTRKEEYLLSQEELEAVNKLRRQGMTANPEQVLGLMKQTANNEEFISRVDELFKDNQTK